MTSDHEVWHLVEVKRDAFFALSDRIWDRPELNYQEHFSATEHAELLEREGFRVTRAVAGIPTAVMGETGRDGR